MDATEGDFVGCAYLIVGYNLECARPDTVGYAEGMETLAGRLAQVRAGGGSACFAVRVYESDGSNVEFMRREAFEEIRKKTGYLPCERSNPETFKFAPTITPHESDIVVERPAFSPFHKTNLHAQLQERNVRRLAIAGGHAGVCLRATTMAAISHGYEVVMDFDCIGDISEESLRVSLDWFANRLKVPFARGDEVLNKLKAR